MYVRTLYDIFSQSKSKVSSTSDDSFGQTAICACYDGEIQHLPLGCTSKIVEIDFLVDDETLFFAHASGTLVTGRKVSL